MASGRLRLDHPEGVLILRTDVSFGRLDQIGPSAVWCLRQHTTFAWSHGNAKLNPLICHLWPIGNSLVAGIRDNHRLLSVEQLSRWREVMHVGCCGLN